MSVRHNGLKALIRKRAPNYIWNHCYIHRQALASRYANPDHDAVMRIIVKVVNYIKNTASRARTFKKMCQKMRARYDTLLFYSRCRWLSRCNFLCRILALRPLIYTFLKRRGNKLARYFVDRNFVIKLVYLCDIFRKLNRLNISLQGPNKYKIIQDDLIQCFKHLLHSCKTAMQDQNLKGHFPLLNRKLVCYRHNPSQLHKICLLKPSLRAYGKFRKIFSTK